ncbi:MAG: hypothetical protein HQL17_07515 [Candidatus Omnitrophica bacterium]|nr:hypothetical protein [Candidatus Omnitrophota bacterium]
MSKTIERWLLLDPKVVLEIERYQLVEREHAGRDICFVEASEVWLRQHAWAWLRSGGNESNN